MPPSPCPPPSSPVIAVPAGACECHSHLYGPHDRFPFDTGKRDAVPEATLQQYRAMLDAIGVQRGVLVLPSVYGFDNAPLKAWLTEAGPDLRGVAILDASVTEAELRELDAAGVRGTRIAIDVPGGTPIADLEPLAEKIAPLGWHIQLRPLLPLLEELAPRLQRLPVDLVVDHMGGALPHEGVEHPGFQALLRLLDSGRCWVKLSGPYQASQQPHPYADMRPFARALVAANPERLVWGVNWPHPRAAADAKPDDGKLLDVLADWAPDEALRKRILVDNAERLYGFP